MTARRHPWQRSLRRFLGDEGGSVLLISLVMVFVIALLATAVLSYTGTSLMTTKSVTDDRKSLYAADGALDTAIQQIAADPNLGYTNTACPALSTDELNGVDATVACLAQNPKVDAGTGNGDNQSDAPANAVLTLGQNANQPNVTRTTDQCGLFWWTRPDRNDTVVEPGTYFAPSPNEVDLLAALFNSPPCGYTSFKESQPVKVAGGVIANSTVVGKGDQSLSATGPIKVRQACAFTGAGQLVSSTGTGAAACDVQGYDSTDPAFDDPGYFHKGQTQGFPAKPAYADNPDGQGNPGTVPACGTQTLVTFKPGWYDDAEKLNALFRTCANADGSGKDYWFMPGVYYFDFRNTTVTQGCGTVGVNSDPGVFDFGDEDLADLVHQWCIRGKNVSDGNATSAAQKRARVIGGTPFGTEEDPNSPGSLRCKADAPYCWNPLPAPITALMKAATATSAASDFSNPNNAKTIDASSSNASWTGATTNQRPGNAATTQISGGDDFAPKNEATGAIDGTPASHTAASFIGSIVATIAGSSQVSGGDDFANRADGRVIGGGSASATIQSQTQTQSPGQAATTQVAQSGTDDFSPRNNATGVIDSSVASHVLASFNAVLNAASATSTTVSGGADFPNADPRGITISDGDTTSSTIASSSTRLDPTVPAVSSTVSGGNDFTPVANLTTGSGSSIDGANASHTLGPQNPTLHAGTSSSSQVSGSDDFADELEATDTPDGSSATATFGATTVTLEPATGNESGADFSPATSARSINGQFASDTLTGNGTSSGDIELNGYPNVPGSTAPTSIRLDVAHYESSTANLTLTVSLRDSDGSLSNNCNNLTVAGSTNSSNVTQVNVPANCVSTISATEADDLQVLFFASKSGTSQSRTINLDGISIVVTSDDTAQRTLTTGGVTPQIPSGATITGVALSITHSESANSGQSVVVTPGGAGACSAVNLTQRPSLATDTVSLSGCTLNTPARINGMTVAYRATAPSGGTQTASVDGITVTVTYTDSANRFVTWTMGSGATSAPDSAILSIRHQETGASLNPRLVITPGNTSTPCVTVNLTTRATLFTDTVDVRASGCLNSAAKLNGAKVQYLVNVTGATTGTATLDGVQIDLVATDATPRGVTVNSFTTSPAVPVTGTLESAVLSVRHQETGSGLSPRLVITPGNTSTPCATVNLTTRATLTVDTVDVRASGCLDTAAELNGAKAQYLVNLTPNGSNQSGTATLDGMKIDVLSTNTTARSITVSSPTPIVPSGSNLDAATLSVRHRESATNLNPRIVITAPSGGCTINLTSSSTLTTQAFDAKTIGGGTCLNTATKLNGATYQYVVNLTANGTAQSATAALDGVNVAVQTTDTANRFLSLSSLSPTVPAAGTLETVAMTVAHQETGSGLNPRIVITPGGGGTCTFNLTPRATLGSDAAIDVKSCLSTPAKINGATLQYTVNLTASGSPASQSGSATLDGMKLDVVSTDTANRSITLSNPTPAAPTAAGTVVSSVGVTVAHRETGAGMNPRLVITPGGAAACAAIPLTTQSTLANQLVDATACLNTPAKVNGATYQYLVNLTANGTGQTGTAAIDGVEVAVATTSGTTKTLTLSAFGAALPAAATNLSSVTIDVAHTESAGTNPRLVVTAGGGGSQTYPLAVRATLGTDTVDVIGLLSTAAKVNGAQVQFLADPVPGANATAAVDGIHLNAGYRPPPGRAPVLGAADNKQAVAPFESKPACDETGPGVQWIFGGDSRIYQPDATVEICAGPSTGDPDEEGFSAQQIAVYGLAPTPAMKPAATTDATGSWQNAGDAMKIGEAPALKTASLAGPQGGPATLVPSTTEAPTSPNAAFTNPERVYVIQGGNSDNDAARYSGNQYAQLVAGGLATIPGGAVPTDVRLNVRHKESTSSTSNISTLKVNVLPATGTTPLCTADLRSPNNLSTSYTTDQFNLTSCLNTAAKVNGARLSYEAKSASSTARDFFLDGLSLVVTYDLSASITLDQFNATPIPTGLKVKNVTARVSHLETGSSFSSDQRPTVAFTNGAGESCGGATTLNTFQRSFWDLFNFFSRDEDGPVAEELDLTACFNGGNSAQRLSGASATFTGRVRANQAENLDGIELVVTFEPVTAATEVFVPESGCITGRPKYEQGYGDPDCALWKWDSAEYRRKILIFGWNTLSGRPNGQTSIRGTVYAPGAAIDVDDQGARTQMAAGGCNSGGGTSVGSACYSGVNYPIFGRGVISRHLRFKGFKLATGYDKAIARCGEADCAGGVNNNTPQPKQVMLTATVDGVPRITAKVCFDAATSGACVAPAATGNRARVLSWNVVE